MEGHLAEAVQPFKGTIYYREFPPPFIIRGLDIPFGRLEGVLIYNGMELYSAHADIAGFEWGRPSAMLSARADIEYQIAVKARRDKDRPCRDGTETH